MEQTIDAEGIDTTIEQMERLYGSLTGQEAPAADTEKPYAPIPAEKDPARHVEEQLDRLLGALGSRPSAPAAVYSPPVAALDGEGEIVVRVDVPGIPQDRLEVTVQGALLTIAGRRPEPGQEGLKLAFAEGSWGSFRRTLWVPGAVRLGDVTAQLRDGVLELRIPKDTAAASARKVAVG